jgi:DHA1 family multidrug resistance protein-like MFS transporter
MNSAAFSGIAIGPLIGGFFSDMFSIRTSFFVASAIMLIPVAIILFVVKEEKGPKEMVKSNPILKHIKGALLEHKIILPLVAIMFVGFLRFWQRPIYPLLVKDIAIDYMGLATQTGIVETSSGIAAVLAGLAVGRLMDKYRNFNFGVFTAVLAAVFLVPQGFVNFFWSLVIFRFVNAFFEGALEPIVNVTIANKVPYNKKGTVFGLVGSVKSIGWSFGALGGGYIAAFFGFKTTFILGGFFFLVICVVLKFVKR